MKFGETFTDYLHGDQERFLDKCSHVEYKRLKKVLKSCRTCRQTHSPSECGDKMSVVPFKKHAHELSQICRCDSCPSCDQKFFAELSKEASEVVGCFSSRVRHLLHMHINSGLQRYMWRLCHCFTDDQQVLAQEGRMLLDYVTMNALAIRKILKKYDKVHGSVNGRNFKIKMQAENLELLQLPWLIELGAFNINSSGLCTAEAPEFFRKFSCDLSDSQPVITMTFSDSIEYEYNLTCAVCLDTVFNPYALSCGHLFCKSCACSSASVFLFQGIKSAPKDAKCPVCRMAGVYGGAVHMIELDLLLKSRCKEYWKERSQEERTLMEKQAKEYWDSQKIAAFGV